MKPTVIHSLESTDVSELKIQLAQLRRSGQKAAADAIVSEIVRQSLKSIISKLEAYDRER